MIKNERPYQMQIHLFIVVSNALKPQRKTSITGLTPATHYIVKVEAYNIAGSSMEEFSFITLTKEGGEYKYHTKSMLQNNDFIYRCATARSNKARKRRRAIVYRYKSYPAISHHRINYIKFRDLYDNLPKK